MTAIEQAGKRDGEDQPHTKCQEAREQDRELDEQYTRMIVPTWSRQSRHDCSSDSKTPALAVDHQVIVHRQAREQNR